MGSCGVEDGGGRAPVRCWGGLRLSPLVVPGMHQPAVGRQAAYRLTQHRPRHQHITPPRPAPSQSRRPCRPRPGYRPGRWRTGPEHTRGGTGRRPRSQRTCSAGGRVQQFRRSASRKGVLALLRGRGKPLRACLLTAQRLSAAAGKCAAAGSRCITAHRRSQSLKTRLQAVVAVLVLLAVHVPAANGVLQVAAGQGREGITGSGAVPAAAASSAGHAGSPAALAGRACCCSPCAPGKQLAGPSSPDRSAAHLRSKNCRGEDEQADISASGMPSGSCKAQSVASDAARAGSSGLPSASARTWLSSPYLAITGAARLQKERRSSMVSTMAKQQQP